MPGAAVPAGHPGTGRGDAPVGAVTGKAAPPLRVQRTARQTCLLPGLLGNVLCAGQRTRITQLHRPPARTAATVAGLLLF